MAGMENITTLEPFLTPFPEPEDVFAGSSVDVAQAARNLLPLITIDLEAIDPDLKGTKVHMLSPFEPYDGVPGENTQQFHNNFVRENVLAFKLTEDNKYEFLADWRYFEAENPDSQLRTSDWWEDFLTHREEITTSYEARKKYFREQRKLYWCGADGQMREQELSYLDSLNETPYWANWSELLGMPTEEVECIDEDGDEALACYPLTAAGERYIFVADVSAHSYTVYGANEILLFFDPKERIALITFDW